MTDWDLMVEYIRRAMEALDRAHEASNELREKTTPEKFDEFHEKLDVLTEELTRLQTVLDHQEAFALDEMADWLSLGLSGTPSEYRRTLRMKI